MSQNEADKLHRRMISSRPDSVEKKENAWIMRTHLLLKNYEESFNKSQ